MRTPIKERLRRARDWNSAIDELEREAENISSETERAAALYELGACAEEVVPERDRALAIYQRAWQLQRENVKPLSRAREVYRELGRLEMVAKVGQIELKLSGGDDVELAGLVGEALLDCGEKEQALSVLQMAVENGAASMRVKDALAAANYDPEGWLDDVERLSNDAKRADAPTAARMLLRAARILHIETPDDKMYEELLRAALAHDPQDESANYLLEELLSTQERWDELEAHHHARAAAAPSDSARADLYRKLALEWVQRFGDRERGADFFARAIELGAQNGGFGSAVAAFTLLREHCQSKGDWPQYLQLADVALAQLAGEQRLFVALQAGEVCWKEMDNIEGARAYFAIAREIEPESPQLQDFDREVPPPEPVSQGEGSAPIPAPKPNGKKRHTKDSEPPEISAAGSMPGIVAQAEPEPEPELEPEPEPEPAQEAAPTAEPVAPVEEEISDELAAAMEEARSTEAASPEKGIEAWRRVIREYPDKRTPRREYARLLRSAEKWNALLEALKDEENKACTTAEEKVAVLHELAVAYRQMNNDLMVAQTLGHILEHHPDDLGVLDQLVAQYESMKRWPDLVKTLQKKAPHVADEGERVALFLRIANLYIERFSNQAEAIKAFEQVLDIDPENDEAIGHLLTVYEKRRDWEKLVKLRERVIERTEDPNERAEMVYEVAKLAATRLKKPDICIHWWSKVLEDDPANEEAIAELEKLFERKKEWVKLAEICTKKANIAADDKTQVDALQKLGLLYTDKLDDPAKAIGAWRRLLETDPNHRRAQDSLKKLYIAERDWDQLEGFYRGAGKLDEFVRVIERQIDSAEPEDKLALALKVAVTYRDEIGKADRAMRAFEKVLQIDAENLEAAEALIPLYEGGRDPRKLVRVLEIQLRQTEDAELRAERIQRLAQWCEERMRDKGAAFGWWLQAHREDHENADIRSELERLAEATGSWGELVEAYQASAAKLEGDDALPVLRVIARVQEKELGEIEAALETNRAILEIDSSEPDSIAALERLYLGRERYGDLLEIYEKKLELTSDPDERAEILFKVGQLYEEEVGDDAKAAETYREVLESTGESLAALRALDRLMTKGGKHAELADILSREIDQVSAEENPAEHCQLKLRLGRVREKHLGDVPGAVALYRDIFDPELAVPAAAESREAARQALEERLEDPDHRQAAAEILEPIYEGAEDWRNLIRVHETQLLGEADQFRKVGLLMRIGELHAQRLGDAEAAFDAFARAFAADPATEGAKRQIEELSNLIDDGWPKMVELFEHAIDSGDLDPVLAHELSLKVARAHEERLGDSDKAVTYYRQALSIEPDDIGAIEALESIFTRGERYPELLDVYRKKADIATEPGERLAILFRIASIHEEMLQQPDEAIAAYREVLSNDPENRRALRSLDRLYAASESWEDLADNLSQQLALAEGDGERTELLLRLAQLRETQLEEPAAAVETYRQVLELSPETDAAVLALERLARSEEHQLTIAQILEPIYKARGDWNKQIGVYQVMAEQAFDPERKIELYHQIGELYEIGGDDPDSAFATYAQALRDEPSSELTAAQLDRLARMLGKWADLVSLYGEVARDTADDELRVSLLTRAAQIQELELGDEAAAVATYKKILEVVPTQIEAAAAIQAIHERGGDYQALVGALKTKAEILMDLPEKKAHLHKAAQIQEEVLDDPEAAIATYREVLDLDDLDVHSMDSLERLYIRLERWEPLKDVYARKADLAEDPDVKKRMLYVLGQVYDRELGDVAKAIETYQQILDIDDDEVPAIQALDRLYGADERWYELLQNLERQVELAEMPAEVVGLKYRIGQLWQERLNDLTRAIESYKEALERDFMHAETLAALDAIIKGDGEEPVLAARVLEPIYEASAEFEKLIEVLEVMVAHADDPVAKVELLHRIAELYEHRLERPTEAFSAFSRALREDNAHELTLGHLERLADYTGQWRPLAELYSSEADKSLDVPRQVDLLSRLARIYEDEIAETESAINIYRRILDVEFDNHPAIMALDRLYSMSGQHKELSEILRREIQLADSDEAVIALQFRLGQVLEQALGDLPAAIEVYREILTTAPEHTATLGALEMLFLDGSHQMEIANILEPLYETAGEFEKLHRIHEVQLQQLSDPLDRQSMYSRLAELSETQLMDPSRAFRWWGEALCEDPSSEQAFEEVERLAREHGLWHDLTQVYIRQLERHAATDVQRRGLLRLARVYEEELADAHSAVESHLRVLSLDENDPDALAALDRLYGNAGMFDELVEILRRRIAIAMGGDEIVEMQLRRGQIFAEALGDLDQALACYEQVLDQDSRNRAALEAEEQIYFRREAWQELYQVYEKLVDVADDEEMAGVYARMARLSSDALGDDETAIDLWQRVLDIRGEEPQALGALGELYGRREMWEELVDVIDREVAVTEDDYQRVAAYKRLGRVWAEKLGRERNALEAWTNAEAIDPNDLETLRALANLYRATQSWEELSVTLRRVLEVGQVSGQISERDMIELYAQLGALEGDMLGRVNEAVEAWRRVMALDYTDFRALNALEQLFTREARWEECIEILERRAGVLEDPATQIDTLLQAAAIWEEKVEDADRAAEIYSRVREYDPSNDMASQRLEAIYRAQYQWEKLCEILLERVEHTEEVDGRIEIFQKVAKVFEEELGDQENAFTVLQYAFEEDYAHESTARELERLATATGKWTDLLQQYSQVVQGLEGDDPAQAADLWVKIGRWYAEHAGHVDYAIHSVQQALRLDDQHLGALGALADLQRQRGSTAELVETLRRHAEIEPDTERRVELYIALAQELEEKLGDPVQAIAAYQAALAADATSMPTLVALERLYRAHEMWEQLIDVLRRMADLRAEEEEKIRLTLEIGLLWDVRMLDASNAIRAYQQVLELEPHNLQALRALEELYEKTGQSEQYLDILEAQLDASPTDAEQISLYGRMASAWEERFGKLDRAAECLEKIVAIDERNYDAYRELARLYRQQGKFDSLVDTYRRHIYAVNDVPTQVDLYCAMGDVYERELGDPDRAIEAYHDTLTFDANEPRALDALGRLYEGIEEWERAIDVMTQLVGSVDEPAKQVDLYHRIGRVTHRHLEMREEAEQHFLQALTIDPGHVATMHELVDLYSARGDWLKAAQMMIRAEGATQNVLEKVRLLHEAAKIYDHRLQQRGEAAEYYAAVLALDPEHVEAGEPLANLYFEAGEWDKLSPILDMLVRKAEGREAAYLLELYYRSARCADELGNFEKALQYYKAAYDIDSTYLPVLVGRADLLFKMQDWESAGKIYQTILVQHRDSQAESDVVRTYYRLGMVRQNLGERKKALNMFEKALEIDPTHADTLEAVISIQEAQGDWEAVIHAKRGLLATADTSGQIKLLEQIADIYFQRINNPQKAIGALREALEIQADNHKLLQKLLDLYTSTEQWKKSVETIERFIALEEDHLRRGHYYNAAGDICRGKMKSIDEAVEYYERSLDSFFEKGTESIPASLLPRTYKPFERIDKLLTTKRDWKGQERAYRRMIKRLKEGDNILVNLWHNLGEIYRSRLKEYSAAIAAFEVAMRLEPTNIQRREILAELYVMAGPDQANKAVAQHMELLKQEPFRTESYKELRRIYMDTRQYDKAWCVCATLSFLKKADPEETQFYEQYKPRGFVKAKHRLTEENWKQLLHEDENRYVSAIFGAIWAGAAMIHSMPHKQFGLRRKDRRVIETDDLNFSRIFYYTGQVLNVPLPEVYLQPEQQGEILIANVHERGQLIPSFVVRAGLLSGRPEKEIAFSSAQWLSYMRPDHFLKLALATNTDLKRAFLSAIVLVKRDFPIAPDMQPLVAQYLPEMQKRITPQMLEQLGMVVHRFLQAAPEVNLKKWGNAVEASSYRAGFVVSGDLEVAARMVSMQPTVVGGPTPKDRVKELVLFSVSEDYFAVRSALGLQIG